MKIEKNYRIEYAHRLPGHARNCKHIHGHTGRIKVVFDGQVDGKTGMVKDFGDFGWLSDLISMYDHSLVLMKGDKLLDYLLEGIQDKRVDPLRIVQMPGPPTAENLAEEIFRLIVINDAVYRKSGLNLVSVRFEETVGNAVTTYV